MLLIGLFALFLHGCDSADAPPDSFVELENVSFDRGRVSITTDSGTHTLSVEVAESDQQRRLGLMRRESLAADSGMIFLFPSPQSATDVFWMFQTYIPLSIAFIGEDGRIGNIRDMEPCPSPYPQYCPNYEAGVPFVRALEVNRGWFAERGIGIGDLVTFERE